MFEQASKIKLRFDSIRGALNVEDLWTLPLTSKNGMDLDTIAKQVNRKLKDSDDEESFVVTSSGANTLDKLRLDILKHIIQVKLEEREKRAKAAEIKEKKQQILEIIERKQNAELESKDLADLNKMLEELE